MLAQSNLQFITIMLTAESQFPRQRFAEKGPLCRCNFLTNTYFNLVSIIHFKYFTVVWSPQLTQYANKFFSFKYMYVPYQVTLLLRAKTNQMSPNRFHAFESYIAKLTRLSCYIVITSCLQYSSFTNNFSLQYYYSIL